MMDFQTLRRFKFLQNGTHGGMLNVANVVDKLDCRINDAMLVLEKGRQFAHGNVAVFVDRKTKYGAAMFPVPGRIIRAATKKRDPEGGARDNHDLGPSGHNGAGLFQAFGGSDVEKIGRVCDKTMDASRLPGLQKIFFQGAALRAH